ncbi:MAG: SPFH/Band 7/PHB domain protein, partial [Actinomycetota bacterium]|nr:SPFH/Band 7/PHB domain protein [Actinomycetota bacterium]
IVPSDFGKALEGFTKMLGAPGDDGVFRFEPSRDYVAASRPEDDDEAVAGWFDTATDPEVAAAVRAAEEVARREVPRPEVGTTPSLGPPIRPAFSGQPGATHHVTRPKAPPPGPPDPTEPDSSADQ